MNEALHWGKVYIFLSFALHSDANLVVIVATEVNSELNLTTENGDRKFTHI